MGARVLPDWRICRVTGDALSDLANKEIYILAGETIGITIRENGRWEFDDDREA